jgi:hypothetical protein
MVELPQAGYRFPDGGFYDMHIMQRNKHFGEPGG